MVELQDLQSWSVVQGDRIGTRDQTRDQDAVGRLSTRGDESAAHPDEDEDAAVRERLGERVGALQQAISRFPCASAPKPSIDLRH